MQTQLQPAHQAAIDAGISPTLMGALDAAAKRPCTPDTYYVWDGQQAEYCESYLAEAEAMAAAHRFGLMLAALVGEDDLRDMLAAQELVEARADEDYWRGGAW